jgi:hypothetical protein
MVGINSLRLLGMRWKDKNYSIMIDENFTGSLQLNFFKGGVSNINRNESMKAEGLEEKPQP